MKTKYQSKWLSTSLGLALLVPLCLSCGKSPTSSTTELAASTGANSVMESDLLNALHEGNQQEIAVAQLAQQQASLPAIKDFAGQLVKDHQEADKRVTALAKKLNVTLAGNPVVPGGPLPVPTPGATPAPTAPTNPGTNPAMNTDLEHLRGLTGEAFDQSFLEMMIESHQQTVEQLQAVVPQLGTSEVATLVKDLLPKFQDHLKKAQSLLEQLGSRGGSPGTSGGKFQKGKAPTNPPISKQPEQQKQQNVIPEQGKTKHQLGQPLAELGGKKHEKMEKGKMPLSR